jgi:glycerate 2-kinase
MQGKWIKNFNQLANTENRKLALIVAEAGLSAINTEKVIVSSVKLKDNILSVMGESFDLSKFKKIKVVGFGKSSCEAAITIEKVLGDKIKEGAVIGLSKVLCANIETFAGTHPRSSDANLEAGEKIYEIAKNSNEDDLIIALVSGGGSAFLCYPRSECDQSISLYNEFLKCGKTRIEMNTVWKHLSLLKGGGLAKVAYPATVIGLIFSDIPGDNFENVASGPTYKDMTTVVDAEKLIAENNLGNFELIETPKEEKYFEKVHNFVLVSNKTAVEAMARKGEELGFQTKIVSTEIYDEVNTALDKIFSMKEKGSLILGAGEPSLEVKGSGGKGGRNLHMGLVAIKMGLIDDESVFLSLASDGMDNSDVAGALVDKNTLAKTKELGLDASDYANRFDSYNFFQKVDGQVMTGPTGANVSDLMILLTKK